VLETFTVDTFTAVLGRRFTLALGEDAALELELVEASLRGVGADNAARDPFGLVFTGPPAPQLPQGNYHLAQDAIGEFDLFIVPIGADAEAVRYEAIFS
jgi:hypothetical protein